MKTKTRIGILGLGGVGGYFGGLLAEHYHNSEEAEIIFIARPSTATVIREKGLQLITPQAEKVIHPGLVASTAGETGLLDVLICAMKSYDLEESLLPLRSCISSKTLILPLLNGVDAAQKIAQLFPQAKVLEGCVYLVSRRIEPGIIKEAGGPRTLFFGSATLPKEELQTLETIFRNANIDAHLSENIQQTTWEKFVFISVLASLTSYYDRSIGGVMEDEAARKKIIQLLQEVKAVAGAKGIFFPGDIIRDTLKKMEQMSYENTSSMHSDFKKGGKTEFASLTEYVSLQGDLLGIETPGFDEVGEILKLRIKN